MKRFLLFGLVCCALITLSSCGTTKQLVSNIKPYEIDKILIIKPLTKIDTIGYGNKSAYDKNTSTEVSESVAYSIETLLPKRIKQLHTSNDSFEQFIFQRELFRIVGNIEQLRKIEGYVVNDTLIGLLDKYDCNYAIGALDFGFTRSRNNYNKQLAKGIGIGILTLGMAIPVPYKSASTMYCFIVDRENKNIAFYRSNIGIEHDPRDKMVIFEQVLKLLKPYFKSK